MYVIIWEYQVKVDHVADFETIYAPNGAWAELFREGNGFINTELLCDEIYPQRYITIDRWVSSRAYEGFLAQWHKEHEALDAYCKGLTEWENLLATGESLTHQTR
jgi:quinol monooxygenase YgiN